MPERSIDPLIYRPDIGACYCQSDAPDRCRWDQDRRRWVGPCDPWSSAGSPFLTGVVVR